MSLDPHVEYQQLQQAQQHVNAAIHLLQGLSGRAIDGDDHSTPGEGKQGIRKRLEEVRDDLQLPMDAAYTRAFQPGSTPW